MGLEEVEESIKERIAANAASTRQAAEKEAVKILENAKKKVAELQQQRDLEIKKLTDELGNREIAAANLSARKLKMDAKKDAIDKVYSRIGDKTLALKEENKAEIVVALIEKAAKELSNAKYVLCSQGDRAMVKELIDGTGLELGETIPCTGGIALENSDRTIRVDYTYETLLEMFKKETLKGVTEQLFGK